MKKIFTKTIAVVVLSLGLFACADDTKTETKTITETSTETGKPYVAAATNSAHPVEQKMDDFITLYMNRMNAVLDEKNDDAAVAKLQALDAEITPKAKVLQPEIKMWVEGLSESEKNAFEKRMAEKPYFKAMLEMMFDQRLTDRMEKNPKFKEAFEKINNNTSEVFNSKDNKEDNEEE